MYTGQTAPDCRTGNRAAFPAAPGGGFFGNRGRLTIERHSRPNFCKERIFFYFRESGSRRRGRADPAGGESEPCRKGERIPPACPEKSEFRFSAGFFRRSAARPEKNRFYASGKCTPGATGRFAFWGCPCPCARSRRVCSEQYIPVYAAPSTGSATQIRARKSVIRIGICNSPAFAFLSAVPPERPEGSDTPTARRSGSLYQYMGGKPKDIRFSENIMGKCAFQFA